MRIAKHDKCRLEMCDLSVQINASTYYLYLFAFIVTFVTYRENFIFSIIRDFLFIKIYSRESRYYIV